MAADANVVFRRIRGRLVPIRLNKSQKQQAKGFGIAAAGAAVAATGGRAYRSLVNKSATSAFRGFNMLDRAMRGSGPAQLSLFDMGKQSALKKSAEASLKAGKRLGALSKSVRLGSTVIGAGLMGLGATKVINGMDKKQKRKISPELLAGGSAAAAVIAPQAYEASKKVFSAGMANRQTAMKFGSSAWAKHGPKIKDLLKTAVKAKL